MKESIVKFYNKLLKYFGKNLISVYELEDNQCALIENPIDRKDPFVLVRYRNGISVVFNSQNVMIDKSLKSLIENKLVDFLIKYMV